jgi:23S rRNA (uracil1939-C5)-methyltransferase
VDCPHAHECPGCPAIGLPYQAQLQAKRARVLCELGRHRDLADVAVPAPHAAEPNQAYRTRAKLPVDGARIGLYGAGHRVVDTPECRVLAPALQRTLAALRALLAAPPEPARGALAALRAVDLRQAVHAGETRVLVTLIVDARARLDREGLRAAAGALRERAPEAAGVAASFSGEGDPRLLGRDLRVLAGEAALRDSAEPSAPWTLATHGAFAQVHRGEAARIQRRVREALGPARGQRVLELYAGSGALSLALAAGGARVTLVDAFAPALETALRAASEQSVQGLETRAGDARAVLAALAREGARFDAVIANPPRRGMEPGVREAIARLAPRVVAYVSCEPATLARDLAHLRLLGFACAALDAFDMIPQTEEVETLAVLRPAPLPPPRVLYRDAELIAVEKSPHEPTIPHPEHASSLLARVQRLPGAEKAAPLHRLDAGTSGVCLFVRSAEFAAPWARALASPAARKEYVACARGVTRAKGSIARPLPEQGRSLPARTRYARTEVAGGHSLLRVFPDSGRTQQIRRHLAMIGHALLGDARHGHSPSNRHAFERTGLDRPFLHCARIELPHARSGEPLAIECELAGDLVSALERLRGGPPATG